MQNYTIDTNGTLVESTTADTIARRLQYGENSVFVVGRSNDIQFVKGTAKRFIPNISGEYNGKAGIDVTGIADLQTIQHDDKIWEIDGKKAKLGKLIKRAFPGMPDAMLNVVLGNIKSRDNVAIEVSDDVVGTYDESFGGGSCMTGRDSRKMRVLQDNGVKVLRVQKDDNTARALLWTCDDESVIVDRIYPNDSPLVSAIHNWAGDNDYWYRNDNSHPSGSTCFVKGGKERNDFKFTLSCDVHDGCFPYLDSFHYGDANGSDEIVLNITCGNICFDGTDGTHSEQMNECPCCGSSTDTDDIIHTGSGDIGCINCCDRCEDCDEWYDRDDVHHVDGRYVCGSCIESGDYSECKICNEVFHIDDMFSTGDGLVHTSYESDYVFVDSEGYHVREEDAVYAYDTSEGHLKSDCKECAESGEWYYNWEDCGIVTSDGDWVHEDNASDYTVPGDSDDYHRVDDCVKCVESEEYFIDPDSAGEMTNRGFVSSDNLDDYFEFDGSYFHNDDAEENGFVYAEDTDEYIKKADAYVCPESGEFVSQPLFVNV